MRTPLLSTLACALFACVSLVAGCDREDATATQAAAAPKPGLSEWALPTAPGAGQPDLVVAPDGRLLLSWLDSQAGRRTRLQYAEYDVAAARWFGPKTIAIGASFVVNWADTPHILATPDGALWVQWLQKSGDAPAAYDVVLSTSRNDGMNWSEPLRPHTDGTTTEHGFAALWPQGGDRLGIAWLDGRNTAPQSVAHREGGHEGHGAGAMTLRSAVFDGTLRTQGDAELDASVCDCCQTDVAVTAKGALLVYRDRSEGEIRDIQSARFDGSAWSAPKPVFADNWKMPACPVNGPSVAARGDAAIVGWYTAADDRPMVKLSHSRDAGNSFAAPVVLDEGDAVQGRVDVALDERNAWALWLREADGAQTLMLARYAPDLSKQLEKVEVAKLQGRGRATGFPQLALRKGVAYIVWTDVAGRAPLLEGATYVPSARAP
jgi:hypothetical protein